MELSWIHGITESSEKSTEMSVILYFSYPNGPKPCTWSYQNMKTLALLHLPNCIQHSHLPSAEGFLPLKICLISLNLKRVVYCFTMDVQK